MIVTATLFTKTDSGNYKGNLNDYEWEPVALENALKEYIMSDSPKYGSLVDEYSILDASTNFMEPSHIVDDIVFYNDRIDVVIKTMSSIQGVKAESYLMQRLTPVLDINMSGATDEEDKTVVDIHKITSINIVNFT